LQLDVNKACYHFVILQVDSLSVYRLDLVTNMHVHLQNNPFRIYDYLVSPTSLPVFHRFLYYHTLCYQCHQLVASFVAWYQPKTTVVLSAVCREIIRVDLKTMWYHTVVYYKETHKQISTFGFESVYNYTV
jgi:hypothetical protein